MTAATRPMSAEMSAQTDAERVVLALMRRKPALADVFVQIGQMVLYRRNCRTQIEVVDGILRRYDLTPATRFDLAEAAQRVLSGGD